MANTKSAKKQTRQNAVRREKNLRRRSAIKTAVKKVVTAVEQVHPIETLQTLLKDVASKLSRAKSKKVMHPKTASRKLSRLAKKVSKTTRTAKK